MTDIGKSAVIYSSLILMINVAIVFAVMGPRLVP